MSKKFTNGIEVDGTISKTGGTANQILNADGSITEKTSSVLREVTYAASVTDAYSETQPNFYIDLTGNIILAVSGITFGGGIVNLNRSTGNEVITLTGVISGNHNYPTGASDTIRLTYSFEQGQVVWGCENPLSAVVAPTVQTIAGTGTSNIDFANGTIVKLNLGAQDEVLTITDPTENTEILFLVKQDSVGSRTIILPSRFGGIGDTVIASLSSAANAVDYVAYSFIDGLYYPKPIIQDVRFADVEAPTAPTSLVASNETDTTVDLTWVAGTDNVGVTGYRIYNSGVLLDTVGNVTSHTLTGLTELTNYILTVRAIDAGSNESPDSNSQSITTLENITPFIAEVTTTGASELFTLPTNSASTNNINVDWGDGTDSDYNGTAITASHTYTTIGVYTVTVSGAFGGIYTNGTLQTQITDITQWGGSPFTSFNFQQYRNDITATDTPDISALTTLSSAFRDSFNGITSLNNINTWDVSSITNTSAMFRVSQLPSTAINGIENWVGFAPQNISSMFRDSPNTLNHDLSGWSIANLTNAVDFNLDGTAWSTANYDATLIGWAAQGTIQSNVTLTAGAASVRSSASNAAYTLLTGTYGWTIIDSLGSNGGTI